MRRVVLLADGHRVGAAERDVRGGVLVEERVEEDACPGRRCGPRGRRGRPRPGARRPRRGRRSRAGRRRPRRRRSRTARPPRNSTSSPRMIDPPTTSGFVARTTPSTRAGSGELKISSDGRLGMWTMPSTVEKRAAMKREVGSSPTVRSVPGPSKCRASKRRALTRSAASTSWSARARQAATGSSSSRRQTWTTCSASRASAASGSSSGCTSCAHAGVGQGTAVQFVVRSLTTWPASRRNGSWSRPTRAGSRSSSRPGATGPVRPIRARAELAELEDPPAVPRRHVVERLLVGVQEPRALDVEVEVLDVDEPRAVAVGAGGERARQRLLAQLGADGDDLAALDVGARTRRRGRRSARASRGRARAWRTAWRTCRGTLAIRRLEAVDHPQRLAHPGDLEDPGHRAAVPRADQDQALAARRRRARGRR